MMKIAGKIFIVLLVAVAVFNLMLARSGYTHFEQLNTELRKNIVDGKGEVVKKDNLNDYQIQIVEDGGELRVIVYKVFLNRYKVYVDKEIDNSSQRDLSYNLVFLENDEYLYTGIIRNEEIAKVVFLGEEVSEYLSFQGQRYFYGVSTNYQEDSERYSAYDADGNLIDKK